MAQVVAPTIVGNKAQNDAAQLLASAAYLNAAAYDAKINLMENQIMAAAALAPNNADVGEDLGRLSNAYVLVDGLLSQVRETADHISAYQFQPYLVPGGMVMTPGIGNKPTLNYTDDGPTDSGLAFKVSMLKSKSADLATNFDALKSIADDLVSKANNVYQSVLTTIAANTSAAVENTSSIGDVASGVSDLADAMEQGTGTLTDDQVESIAHVRSAVENANTSISEAQASNVIAQDNLANINTIVPDPGAAPDSGLTALIKNPIVIGVLIVGVYFLTRKKK